MHSVNDCIYVSTEDFSEKLLVVMLLTYPIVEVVYMMCIATSIVFTTLFQ